MENQIEFINSTHIIYNILATSLPSLPQLLFIPFADFKIEMINIPLKYMCMYIVHLPVSSVTFMRYSVVWCGCTHIRIILCAFFFKTIHLSPVIAICSGSCLAPVVHRRVQCRLLSIRSYRSEKCIIPSMIMTSLMTSSIKK